MFLGNSQFITTLTILLVECDVIRCKYISFEDSSIGHKLGIEFGAVLCSPKHFIFEIG